jgi:hypothetical protein
LKNTGNLSLSDVELIVPYAEYAYISTAGKTEEFDKVKETLLPLGKLAPDQSVKIVIWSFIEPASYHAEGIVIRHRDGVGRVDVKAPVGSLGQAVDKHLMALLIFFTPLLFAAAGVALVAYNDSKKASTKAQENSEVATTPSNPDDIHETSPDSD